MYKHKTQAAPVIQEDGYTKLGNAIILQAVKDYRDALRTLRRNPYHNDANSTKNEVERFFHSQWYGMLTSIDPDMLIRKLKEEVE